MVFFIFIKSFIRTFCKQTEEPDQMPRSVASDLDLHCLPMSHKKDGRLLCIGLIIFFKPFFG